MERKDKTIVLLQIHNIRIPKQFHITPPGNDRIPLDLKFDLLTVRLLRYVQFN